MKIFYIKKGLNIPVDGAPVQEITGTKSVNSVALIGDDYIGMKPSFHVKEGDHVKLGQLLFTDKRLPAVSYTSPGTGMIRAINRGEKRKFLSIVIELEDVEEDTSPLLYNPHRLENLDRDLVKEELLKSGLWNALRSRPFGRTADPDDIPKSIFVTAIDTRPLAPSVDAVIDGNETDFKNGIRALKLLTDGPLYVCVGDNMTLPKYNMDGVETVVFKGPHPTGLAGTHIHFIDPASRKKIIWNIDYQEVIAFGKFFTSGEISVERVVSIAGPSVKTPRLIKTRLGASTDDIIKDELLPGNHRIISGSPLYGHEAKDESGYLGRYNYQITGIPEGGKRKFFGWMAPRKDLFSAKKVFLLGWLLGHKYVFDTSLNGSLRPIIPIGAYESVMPLDMIPTYLLKYISVENVDMAEKLGCLELVEEDLSLCTYVCPGKNDFAPPLRNILDIIYKEG